MKRLSSAIAASVASWLFIYMVWPPMALLQPFSDGTPAHPLYRMVVILIVILPGWVTWVCCETQETGHD